MKMNLITALFILFTCNGIAQRAPINGSGKIVTKSFDLTGFTEINIRDLDGKCAIEVGKNYGVTIVIDDNLEELLEVNTKNNKLSVSLKGNRNNKMYIENTNIVIKISLPLLTKINQDGNNSLYVDGINGTAFSLICRGNGNATLTGKAGDVDITCTGNGTVYAQNLLAGNMNIIKRGNGSVYTNTDNSFNVQASGNGNITNTGKGKAAAGAKIAGNGDILYPNQQKQKSNKDEEETTKNKMKKITVKFKNNTNKRINLSVKYPVKGSYGITIPAKDTLQESFPVGTKICRGSHANALKKPLFLITEESGSSDLLIGKEEDGE